MGKVLKKCKFIVSDVCTMARKKSVDALYRLFTWKRFQANITCYSLIDINERNKYLSEIFHFVMTRKDVKINYKYAYLAAKRSISWNILTSVAGNWERKGAD
ncbi:unnamed protein product [Onchocerca flexuosa]|uniref:Transposase n=1 Tax=Onchocerca flexuosa TaxID=387005 RepID=A0A183I1A1_9BILA|nr:unnamed protein product [Onchocerca flexuosa]